jgi:hypothetical protein
MRLSIKINQTPAAYSRVAEIASALLGEITTCVTKTRKLREFLIGIKLLKRVKPIEVFMEMDTTKKENLLNQGAISLLQNKMKRLKLG